MISIMIKNNFKILGILFFVISIFFNQVMIGDELFLSSDTLSAKTISHGIQLAEDKYGEYPLWMPWIFAGLPSTHSMQNVSEYYFPHQIISLIKMTTIPWFWNFLLHFIFCGFGMYLLLRKLKVSDGVALFGAISFMIAPYMVVMIVHGHGSQVMTASYIPWIMWALLRLQENPSLQKIGVLSLLIGLQLQRAHIQIAYYTWMLMIAYLIFTFIVDRQFRGNINFYLGSIISSLLGFCMSLWIYIPLLNYAGLSNRSISNGGSSMDYATSWSLHPFESLTMLLPSSFGFGDSTYFGYMPFTNFPNYAGLILIILSICAFYNNSKNKIIFFFLFILISSLLISFGKFFPLYGLLYDWLPYFNKFRVPSMILILSQFSICLIASIGFDNLLAHIKSKDRKVLNILGGSSLLILLIAVWRYFSHDFSTHRIQHQIINLERTSMIWNDVMMVLSIFILCVLTLYLLFNKKIDNSKFILFITIISLFDIGRVNQRITNPPEDIAHPVIKNKKYFNAQINSDEIIEFFKLDKSKFRVLPLGEFADNRLVAFNIETVTGYHPAKLASYETLMAKVGINENMLKLLNVKYILSPSKLPNDQAKALSLNKVKSGKYYNNFEYKNAHIYEYAKFESRVQFAKKLNLLNSVNEGYSLLNKEDFSLSKNSFIIDDATNKLNLDSLGYSEGSSVEISEWSPNKIVINSEIVGRKDHFVILSEAYFPYGWKVVGASDDKIFRVNNFIRGFFVPPGSSEITLYFNPQDINYSSIITYVFFLLILGLIFSKNIRLLSERI